MVFTGWAGSSDEGDLLTFARGQGYFKKRLNLAIYLEFYLVLEGGLAVIGYDGNYAYAAVWGNPVGHDL